MRHEVCPSCKHRFSDWFVWPTGHGLYRYCFLCWVKSGYHRVILERAAREGE